MGNLALNNALSGVLSSQEALDVISQNVSNAEDENYSRQRANIKSNRPILRDGNFFGSGVNVDEVLRNRDQILEQRLNQAQQDQSRLGELSDVFQQIETFLNEPSEEGIRGLFSDLDQSLQTLANDPENRGARSSVVGKAQSFTNDLRGFHNQLQDLAGPRGTVPDQINNAVQEVNALANQIAELNTEIATERGRGGSPNDLLDERDAKINELSKLGDIRSSPEEGNFRITLSGFTLVQGGESHELEFAQKREGEDPKILYDNPSRSVVEPKNGQLKALLDARDEVIPGIINELNDLTVQYVDRFNDLHKSGFGLDGQTGNKFFEKLPTQDTGIFRLEGSGGRAGSIQNQRAGFIDSPDVALAGDPSTNKPENFEDDESVSGLDGAGNTIGNPTGDLTINENVISYDMTEDSMNDIIDRINDADNKAEAYLSAENRLVIKGSKNNDYQLSKLSDTGLLLDKANILRVGGSNRIGTESISDASQKLTAGGDLTGNLGLDTHQKIQNNPAESSSGETVQVQDASVFEAGEEVQLVEREQYEVKTATIDSVDSAADEITLDVPGFSGDFDDDTTTNEKDFIAKSDTDLAEGTLEFGSSNSPGFTVNYDTNEDSLNDLIDRINDRAINEDSNIRVGKDQNNRLEMFSFDTTQNVSDPSGASTITGDDTEVQVTNVEKFEKGQKVGIFGENNNSSTEIGETTEVESVDEENGTVTVDLANEYDTSSSGNVEITPDFEGNFRVNDEASQQIRTTGGGFSGSVTSGTNVDVGVKNADKFQLGDEIRITSNDGAKSENAQVVGIDTGTNELTLDELNNTYSFGQSDNDNNAAIQTSADTNENRNLLSALGMNRELNEIQPGTELAIEGESGRPPVADANQVASFRVNEKIADNPDLIAAAQGNDVDLDGITESSLGPGDSSNVQALSSLKTTNIMENATLTPDEKITEFITNIGSESSFIQSENSAAEKLVGDLKNQRQQTSGVNIDEEMTNMLKHQQVFQASSRIIQTTDQLIQSLLQIV